MGDSTSPKVDDASTPGAPTTPGSSATDTTAPPSAATTQSCSSATALRSPFYYLGAGVASHWAISLAVVALGIVALGALNVGWIVVENETDVEELWVDRKSHVYADIQYVKKHVPQGGGSSQEISIVAGADGSGANVLTKAGMGALLAHSTRVRDMSVTVDGRSFVLDDVCFSADPYSWPCFRLSGE